MSPRINLGLYQVNLDFLLQIYQKFFEKTISVRQKMQERL